jgi:hypothetical protein
VEAKLIAEQTGERMEQVIRKSEGVSHREKVPGALVRSKAPGAFGSFKSHTGIPGGGGGGGGRAFLFLIFFLP